MRIFTFLLVFLVVASGIIWGQTTESEVKQEDVLVSWWDEENTKEFLILTLIDGEITDAEYTMNGNVSARCRLDDRGTVYVSLNGLWRFDIEDMSNDILFLFHGRTDYPEKYFDIKTAMSGRELYITSIAPNTQLNEIEVYFTIKVTSLITGESYNVRIITLQGEANDGSDSDESLVANEAIATADARAYAQTGKIVVVTPMPTDVQIISMAGAVVANARVTGRQEFPNLAEGVYIVRMGEASVKLQVRD